MPKIPNFEMLNFENKDLFLMQNVPRNPMVPFVFLNVVWNPPKITLDCMTSPLGVIL